MTREAQRSVEIEVGNFTVPESIRGEGWICYRIEEDSKVPCDPSLPLSPRPIDPTDTTNCVDFTTALDGVERSRDELGDDGLSGVGIVLDAHQSLVGIDYDHVVDDGRVPEWVWTMIDEVDSYAELSPSGDGIHLLVRSNLGLDDEYGNKGDAVEFYEQSRFFTFTCEHITGTPTEIRQESALGLVRAYQHRYCPEQSTSSTSTKSPSTGECSSEKEWNSPDGLLEYEELTELERELVDTGCEVDDDFRRLFEEGSTEWDTPKWSHDRSRADSSLASKLKFWVKESYLFGDTDLGRDNATRIFLASDLAKRDKVVKRSDYLDRTLYTVWD